jgi:hypothetical protein
MDAELVALASKGASTVVALLATDAWEKAKASVGALWRRVRPDRADVIEEELTQARVSLLDARASGDQGLEGALARVWQSRLADFLIANPGLADQFRNSLDDVLIPALSVSERTRTGKIEMHARASGHGRVYQAGRDQHIQES